MITSVKSSTLHFNKHMRNHERNHCQILKRASDSTEIFEKQPFCMSTLLTKTYALTWSIMKEKPVSTAAKHL